MKLVDTFATTSRTHGKTLTTCLLGISLLLAGCIKRGVLPEKAGMRSLKCEVVTSPHSTASTTYLFSIDEKNNQAYIRFASGKTLPLKAAFFPDKVTLDLREGDATGEAMRTHGKNFAGTKYGGNWSDGGTETTFTIDRESGQFTYKQIILGKLNQEKPAIGTCERNQKA